MSPDPAPLLDRVRTLCLALPGTSERVSHGAPGFRVEHVRFFAYFWHNHHDDGETVVIVKTVGADEQTELLEYDPACYYKPPYLGASGWIALRLDSAVVDWDRVGDRIAISWELAAPQRLLEVGGR